MEKLKNSLLILFLATIFVMGIILHKKCSSVNTVVTHDTTKIYTDTGKHILLVKVPVPIRVNCLPETILQAMVIDTDAILHKYFCENIYSNVYTDDSTYQVGIIDTIARNTVIGRGFWHKNLKPQFIINNTVINNSIGKWYAGPSIQTGQKLGLGIQVLHPLKIGLVTLNIDVINKSAGAGYLIKLK